MSDNCKELFRLNIGLNNCCGKKKEKNRDKCKPNKCVILPVCEPVECLPEGGEPGDHLVKDGDNNPIWKPANECDCEPGDHLPDGGAPNDFLARDGDNKPVWKPIDECTCEPVNGLPEGGNPNDVLAQDENGNPVWKSGNLLSDQL